MPNTRVARISLRVFAGFALMALAVGTWASYWAPHRGDQYQLITLGHTLNQGGLLYRDVWENKPPGIAWLNLLAIWVSPDNVLGPFIMPGVVWGMTVLVFSACVRRFVRPSVPSLSVLLVAVVASLRIYDTPSINPDCYAAAFSLCAFMLLIRATLTKRETKRLRRGLFAGLFFAAAILTKQTGVLGFGVASLLSLACGFSRLHRAKRWLATILYVWVGCIAALALASIPIVRQGLLEEAWHAIFEFNRGLLSFDAVVDAIRPWRVTVAALSPLALPLWLAVLGVVRGWKLGEGDWPAARPVVISLVVWWAIELLFALMGPSHAMRYLSATFPPMLILAALGIGQAVELIRRAEDRHRTAAALMVVTVVWLLGAPLSSAFVTGVAHAYAEYTNPETEHDRLRYLGGVIRDLVPEGETMYVLDYESGLYVYSDRVPACRHTYPRSAAQMEEIVLTLESLQPRVIAIPPKKSPWLAPFMTPEFDQRITHVLMRHYHVANLDTLYTIALRNSPEQDAAAEERALSEQ